MIFPLQSPAPLKEGDRVTIVSPSSKIDKELVKGQKERLESWGLKVKVATHALDADGNFAGTMAHRLKDFQSAMDDDSVRALFCSRGGYGAIHLLDLICFDRFRLSPKWLIGFSDITALHNLYQREGFVSVHGIMGRHLAMEPADDPQTLALKELLFTGVSPTYKVQSHKLNLMGTAKGILRGGNLSVFYGLRGTPFDLPVEAENTILVLEDVGERPYHVERMMYNLQLAGILSRLKGLVVGQFTDNDDLPIGDLVDKSIGRSIYQVIYDFVKPYGYPVCFNFPVGHTSQNAPLLLGSEVVLAVNKNETYLESSTL